MEANTIPISVKGRIVRVPAVCAQGRSIVITGKWLKFATVHDEEWLPGKTLERPDEVVALLKMHHPRADVLSFAPSEPEGTPQFSYYTEWDNVAVIRTHTYDKWWKALSQDARRNVRLAEKRGVSVRVVAFDDAFVKGIKGIYDETPIRQGREFWHFGKEFEAVKRENSTYLDRSEYIGAYLQEELIGFIKMVYVGKTARIMQILSKNAQFDKKPANAMIAKAVEVSCQKEMSYLAYCRYVYGSKKSSSITEFKRRNGFEELRFPRYYVPLTLRGRIILRLRLHRGLRNVLPEPVIEMLLKLRAKFYGVLSSRGCVRSEGESCGTKEPGAATIE